MKQLIQNIQERLVQEVTAMNYVDQDWGQMDFFTDPPVQFPCALIDVQLAQYTNNADHIQQGTANVIIRLFNRKMDAGNPEELNEAIEDARNIWQLMEEVNKALHGQNFLPEGYGLPMRQQMQKSKREDGYNQTELHYAVQFTDYTCQSVMTPVSSVSPDIKTVSWKIS